jgi:hypothetical protein
MKKVLFTIILLYGIKSYSQGADTIVTNLNLRAGTIKIIAASFPVQQSTMVIYKKWGDAFKVNNPNDNANVNIDTIRTTTLALVYQALLGLPAGLTEVEDYINDFKTSITSKRSSNAYLDQLCDALEELFTSSMADLKSKGSVFLFQKAL